MKGKPFTELSDLELMETVWHAVQIVADRHKLSALGSEALGYGQAIEASCHAVITYTREALWALKALEYDKRKMEVQDS